MTQRDVAAHVKARVATMGRGSTDETLHVQIVDDRRVGECPRGVRVWAKAPVPWAERRESRTRIKPKMNLPDPMSNRFLKEPSAFVCFIRSPEVCP